MSKFLANEWNKATEEMDAKIKNAQETPSPAPWEATPLQIYAGKKHIATAHYAGNPIVDVNEAIANARLIAAAPELLEALKALVARMEENQPAKAKPRDDMHKVYARAVFYRDLQAAREAIAKAESNA